MSTKRILGVTLLWLALAGLGFNQWRLQSELGRIHTPAPTGHSASEEAERATEKLRQAETR